MISYPTLIPPATNRIETMIDTSIFQDKRAKYYTLGCKLNFAETATFAQDLYNKGVTEAKENENADICLINTCSVTEMADHKCRQQIHKMVRENPGALVVITGCYAQLQAEKIASIPGVSMVLGSDEKAQLVDYLGQMLTERSEHSDDKPGAQSVPTGRYHKLKTKDIKSFQPSCAKGNRTRYFLKVQDGCNYFCTYCTIPYARGFSRNASIKDLVKQAEQVAQEGGKEIVITGVNIGDFGRSTNENFIDLVKALDQVEGIQRYRISSLEPDLISDELIEYCALSRAFMPHFHIPLQSGSDEVLKLMHRRYDTQLFADKIHLIKDLMPSAFIGVDVMVGCRGEKPECFDDCYEFLSSLDVTQLHVFPYSERPGTAALKIPYIVSDADRKQRVHKLLALSQQKTEEFYSQHIGKEAEVLFEKAPLGKTMNGFTDNYIRVELPPTVAKAEYDNQIIKVRLGKLNAKHTALCVDELYL